MKLTLIKGSHQYQNEITDMLVEWINHIEKYKTNHSPWAIFKNDYKDFNYYLDNLENKDTTHGYVPDSTFFCLDQDKNMIVGAVNIRHYLSERLLLNGGHIGLGVRPSERQKGIATKMISLALVECQKLNIDKVLMVCDKDNVGSRNSIINNGGVLENEITVDGHIEQRYWIDLSKSI